MTRKLHSAHMLLLLISGCVIADPDSQTVQEQAVSVTQAGGLSTDSLNTTGEPADPLPNKFPGKDEIRTIQTRMKMAGLNPGAIDGVLGPKTIAALHRFQSGCAMVKDLLDETATDISRESHALKLTALASATPRTDDVRAIQTRMRAAGFNPGPSDGILGPRTKSILVGVQSGCTLIKAFPETPDQKIRMVERPAALALTSTKRIQPVALPSPASSGPSKNNSSTLIGSANPTPTNDEIQLVQVRLKDAGFDPGPIDGIMGPKTRTAILRYRTWRGLANSPTRLPGINGILE
jgi:peptidoglycan hydrolase-like protein with peptidoglycan-binding domain